MERTYVYMCHSCSCFYLTNKKLFDEDLYCPECDASDQLIGEYEDEQMLTDALSQLFKDDYDLAPCDNYDLIKDKYCPPEFRFWELGQYEPGSEEYLSLEKYLQSLLKGKK